MRSEIRTFGRRLVAGSLLLFAAMSAEARGQAPDTRPITPARLVVCNALADGRNLEGAAREEYLGDCMLLPALATPPGLLKARPEEPPARRPRAERDPALESGAQRTAPPRAEQRQPSAPEPVAAPEPSPSAGAPDTRPAVPAVSAHRPSVSSTIRIASLLFAVAVFGFSLLMMKIGGRAAAVAISLALVVSLGVAAVGFTVWRTVFNPEFAIAELEAGNAVGALEKMLTGEGSGDPMQEVLRASFKDERPHITAQIGRAVHDLYDYLGGKNADVKLTFQPGTVKETLARHVRAGVAADAPPDASPEEVRQRADETARQIVGELDGMLGTTITLATLPPEATKPLATLRRARPYVMWVLAGAALLSLQCFLLLWLVGSPRWVGVVALVTGAVLLAAPYAMNGVAMWALKAFGGELSTLMRPEVVAQMLSHFWDPLRLFAIATLVVGLAAIGVSFIRRSARPAASVAAPGSLGY